MLAMLSLWWLIEKGNMKSQIWEAGLVNFANRTIGLSLRWKYPRDRSRVVLPECPKPAHSGVGENLQTRWVKFRASARERQLTSSLWTQVGIRLVQAGHMACGVISMSAQISWLQGSLPWHHGERWQFYWDSSQKHLADTLRWQEFRNPKILAKKVHVDPRGHL